MPHVLCGVCVSVLAAARPRPPINTPLAARPPPLAHPCVRRGRAFFVGGRCGSTIFVLAILLCEVPDASRGTGEHHRHAPHARGNRAMVASLGLAKINWVPCPAVGPMGVPIRGV